MTAWLSRPLTDDHDVSAFASGSEALDDWLRGLSRRAQRSGTAGTYVWTSPDSRQVVAYYSIAPTAVARGEVPRSMSGGVGLIPAYLLAWLALDRSLHAQGLGTELLHDALTTIIAAAQTASGRLIVTDAIDENAHAHYLHHGFRSVGDGRRLVMTVASARQALERSPPSDEGV